MLRNSPTMKTYSWFRQVGTSTLACWYLGGAVAQPVASVSTLAIAAVDTLYALPFMSGRGGTIDRIGFEVTTVGGASSATRVGIYTATNTHGNLYPNSLVLDGGSFDTSSVGGTGVKATTVSTILTPNTLYWFVMLCGTAAPTVRCITGTSEWGLLGFPNTIGGSPNTLFSVAQSYGSLPSTFPSSATLISSNIPQIAVRYSA